MPTKKQRRASRATVHRGAVQHGVEPVQGGRQHDRVGEGDPTATSRPATGRASCEHRVPLRHFAATLASTTSARSAEASEVRQIPGKPATRSRAWRSSDERRLLPLTVRSGPSPACRVGERVAGRRRSRAVAVVKSACATASPRRRRPGHSCSDIHESACWDDVHGLAHRGVSQAAQLRAHDGIGTQAVGGDAVLGGDARHGVDLLAELGTQKSWMTSLDRTWNSTDVPSGR